MSITIGPLRVFLAKLHLLVRYLAMRQRSESEVAARFPADLCALMISDCSGEKMSNPSTDTKDIAKK